MGDHDSTLEGRKLPTFTPPVSLSIPQKSDQSPRTLLHRWPHSARAYGTVQKWRSRLVVPTLMIERSSLAQLKYHKKEYYLHNVQILKILKRDSQREYTQSNNKTNSFLHLSKFSSAKKSLLCKRIVSSTLIGLVKFPQNFIFIFRMDRGVFLLLIPPLNQIFDI